MAIKTKVQETVEETETVEERSNDEILNVKNTAHFEVCGILPGENGKVTYGQFKTFLGLEEV